MSDPSASGGPSAAALPVAAADAAAATDAAAAPVGDVVDLSSGAAATGATLAGGATLPSIALEAEGGKASATPDAAAANILHLSSPPDDVKSEAELALPAGKQQEQPAGKQQEQPADVQPDGHDGDSEQDSDSDELGKLHHAMRAAYISSFTVLSAGPACFSRSDSAEFILASLRFRLPSYVPSIPRFAHDLAVVSTRHAIVAVAHAHSSASRGSTVSAQEAIYAMSGMLKEQVEAEAAREAEQAQVEAARVAAEKQERVAGAEDLGLRCAEDSAATPGAPGPAAAATSASSRAACTAAQLIASDAVAAHAAAAAVSTGQSIHTLVQHTHELSNNIIRASDGQAYEPNFPGTLVSSFRKTHSHALSLVWAHDVHALGTRNDDQQLAAWQKDQPLLPFWMFCVADDDDSICHASLLADCALASKPAGSWTVQRSTAGGGAAASAPTSDNPSLLFMQAAVLNAARHPQTGATLPGARRHIASMLHAYRAQSVHALAAHHTSCFVFRFNR